MNKLMLTFFPKSCILKKKVNLIFTKGHCSKIMPSTFHKQSKNCITLVIFPENMHGDTFQINKIFGFHFIANSFKVVACS